MKTVLTLFTALAFISLPIADVHAAAKKKPADRSNYTKAQQKKFFDEATKICRKKFGSSLHRVQVNYAKRQYICFHY